MVTLAQIKCHLYSAHTLTNGCYSFSIDCRMLLIIAIKYFIVVIPVFAHKANEFAPARLF
jgi:hypothetical protein